MDISINYFEIEKKKVTFLDILGHQDFILQMIMGLHRQT
jgi:selenocysteine-specific translation elongation factor